MSTSAAVKITDEELGRLRGRIGDVISISEVPYVTETSLDAIRRWALATGDRNPLYFDEMEASKSPHGSIIAPPCLPYAFSRLSIGYRGGLPGVHSMFGGSHWRWFKPAPVGRKVKSETRFTDLIELEGRFAGRMFRQVSLTQFRFEDESEPFAEVEGWGMRVERGTAREKGKYGGTELANYTAQDLEAISEEYKAEYVRGPEILYWDDVAEGSPIPSTIRGPYTATTAVAFEQAWGGLFIHAHGHWFDYLAKHPAAGINNVYGIPEPPEAVHWDSELARSVGVPEAYDYGPERIAWLSSLLTNWIGHHGFLEELYCQIRRFNLIGDLTRCHGRVEERLPAGADGFGRVRIAIWCQNQRDETTAKGWAIVRLPAR